LFFLLGMAIKNWGGTPNRTFAKIAAVVIMAVALFNINSAWTLTGRNVSASGNTPANAVSEATIYINRSGYTTDPPAVNIRRGSRVKLTVVNKEGYGCIQSLVIPKFGIQRVIPVGSREEISFTAPDVSGPIAFMCSMGMYRGVINVI
jgi:plastocyanin domain-containing protein